jgi:TPP-dependent pyruvate/acetoin dehydrogenase alpha subunit
VYAATQEAVARAREGEGPTLIECVTYRLGVHTTADDPTKYRSDDEVKAWERKDPLTRLTAYLERQGVTVAGLESEIDAEIAAAVERFEATPPPDPVTIFDHVYAERPAHLEQQRTELIERLAEQGPQRRADEEQPSPPMRGQRMTRR